MGRLSHLCSKNLHSQKRSVVRRKSLGTLDNFSYSLQQPLCIFLCDDRNWDFYIQKRKVKKNKKKKRSEILNIKIAKENIKYYVSLLLS